MNIENFDEHNATDFNYDNYLSNYFINNYIYIYTNDELKIKNINDIPSILYVCYYLLIFYILLIKLEKLKYNDRRCLEYIKMIFDVKLNFGTSPNISSFKQIKTDFTEYIK